MSRKLKYLILHCTATPAGRPVTSDDIRRWHLAPKPEGRGWSRVGYTDMIHLNGRVERLANNNEDDVVDSWEITNGAAGVNGVSRHMVYVGGVDRFMRPKDTRTLAQYTAMKKYVRDFVKRFPFAKVGGHNHFSSKACPCFNVALWLRSIGIKEKNIL